MKYSLFACLLLLGVCVFSNCDNYSNPNTTEEGQDPLLTNEVPITQHITNNLTYKDTTYVPIYSDIYSETKGVRFQLTATLSIRNTNFRDTIFISDIEYYDTNGALVREYIDNKVLVLKPMQSIDYVIDEKDDTGGTGANFIIKWGANSTNPKPMFQGVMISTNGQQGISFLVDGISIATHH